MAFCQIKSLAHRIYEPYEDRKRDGGIRARVVQSESRGAKQTMMVRAAAAAKQ